MFCPDENRLLEFIEGRLATSAVDQIESHLSGCHECRHTLLVHTAASASTMRSGASAGDAAPLAAGALVGRYVVSTVLGKGGMGVVYAAFDPKLDREVAIKVIRPERAGREERAELQRRLEREAQAMARLAHPHVLPVYDVGHAGDRVFVAMELCRGGTLSAWLATPRPPHEIVRMMIAAGRGLAAAHAAGLVHRDFKLDNVLLGDDGTPKVSDFGLARSLGDDGAERVLLVGTPAYMAPEQLRGEPADARSDQFSFCVALWRALVGVRPFEGDNTQQLLTAIETRRPTRVRGRGLPRRLLAAVERGLAAAPADRWPDLETLLHELARKPPPWRAIAGGAVVGLALATSTALWVRDHRRVRACEPPAAALAEMWSPARRDAVAGLLGPGSPVVAELDRRVAAWSTMWRDSCEATRLRGEQSAELGDLRVACLDDRRYELGAVTAALADAGADAETRARAAASVHKLTPLEGCADRRALLMHERPPADRAQAERVTALRRDVARARGELYAGRTAVAAQAIDALLVADDTRRYAPLHAQALYLRGALQVERGALADAAASLQQAAATALGGGDDEVAVWAWDMLAYVDGFRRGKTDDALRSLDYAAAAIRRLADREDLECNRLEALGNVLTAAGRREGVAAFEARLACISRDRSAEPDELPKAEANLANALSLAGDVPRAAELHRRSWQALAALLGPEHPDVLRGAVNYGYDLTLVGRPAEAEKVLAPTVASLERLLGAGHPTTANAHTNLAHALVGLGRFDDAIRACEAAVATWTRVGGADHPALVEPLTVIAQAELGRGQPAAARRAVDRALAIGTGAHVPETMLADARAVEKRLEKASTR